MWGSFKKSRDLVNTHRSVEHRLKETPGLVDLGPRPHACLCIAAKVTAHKLTSDQLEGS